MKRRGFKIIREAEPKPPEVKEELGSTLTGVANIIKAVVPPATQPEKTPQPQPQPSGVTAQQVQAMIDQSTEKTQREGRLASMEKELIQLRADQDKRAVEQKAAMDAKIAELKDVMTKKPEPGPEIITAEKLLQILEKRDTDARTKYLEERAADERQRHQDLLKEVQEDRKQMADKLEKLEEAAKRPPVVSTQGYQKDETRLLADAMQILAQRRPIQDTARVVIDLIKPPPPEGEEAKPPERESSGAPGAGEILPREMVKEI